MFPEVIEAAIAGYDRTELVRRRAPSRIVMLEAEGKPPLVLKVATGLTHEAARLRWLEGRLSAPKIVAIAPGAIDHLVMTRLPGIDGTDADKVVPLDAFVQALAAALHRIHALPVEECPFRMTTDVLLDLAESAVAANSVTSAHLSPLYVGESPKDLLNLIHRLRPEDSPLVVGHGDPSLPNVLFEGSVVTGFIDVGTLGVCDPWRDIAIMARSLAWNIGARWIRPFCEAYGVEPDHQRLRFWQLMDEFLMTRKW
jgi:aminoglycoside phosphotransferase